MFEVIEGDVSGDVKEGVKEIEGIEEEGKDGDSDGILGEKNEEILKKRGR